MISHIGVTAERSSDLPHPPPGPGAIDNQLALDIRGIITTARLIDEAEGLAFLGLYVDAWEVLESLSPADRGRPAVLAVRLMVCLGMARSFCKPAKPKPTGLSCSSSVSF